MGDMVITGLSVDAEMRLRQAWQIAPGQVFDDGYYESHLEILAKPSRDIFGELPVHYNELAICFARTQHTTRWMCCWTSSKATGRPARFFSHTPSFGVTIAPYAMANAFSSVSTGIDHDECGLGSASAVTFRGASCESARQEITGSVPAARKATSDDAAATPKDSASDPDAELQLIVRQAGKR